MVERAKILFPLSQIGAITDDQRAQIIRQSRLYGRYDNPVDRESAFEVLLKESEQATKAAEEARAAEEQAKQEAAAAKQKEKEEKEAAKKKGNGIGSKVLKSVVTALTGVFAASVATSVSNKVTGKTITGWTVNDKAVTPTDYAVKANTVFAATFAATSRGGIFRLFAALSASLHW